MAGFQPDAFDPNAFVVGATAGGPSAGGTLVGTNNPSAMYAVAGLARSGAFRSGYVPRDRWLRVVVNGTNTFSSLRLGTMVATAQIDRRQDELTYQTFDFAPARDADIVVSVNSDSNRLFGGKVRSVRNLGGPIDNHQLYQVDCIDYSNSLDDCPNGRVNVRYQNLAADYAIRDMLARWCPGFSARYVPTNLPNIGDLTFQNDLPSAVLDAITKSISQQTTPMNWRVDYFRALHVFDIESNTAPSVEPGRAHYSALTFTRDRGVSRNRFYGEGGGGNTTQDYAVGATVFALDSVLWYPAPYVGTAVVVPGQVFTLAAVDTVAKTITVNEPALFALPQGTSFNNLVQVDDVADQLALYLAYPNDPAKGVRAGFVTDGRKTRDSITQMAQANLVQFSGEQVTGSYTSWSDARPGQRVDINVPIKKLWGQFTIQGVRSTPHAQARHIERQITFAQNRTLSFNDVLRAVSRARRS